MSGILSIIMSIFGFLLSILIIIGGIAMYVSSDGIGLNGLDKVVGSFLWFVGFVILIVAIVELCFGLNALKLKKELSKIRVVFVLSIIVFIVNILFMLLMSLLPRDLLAVNFLPFLVKSIVNCVACIYIVFNLGQGKSNMF